MNATNPAWADLDAYLDDLLVGEDSTLRAARAASHAAGLPDHEVSPSQGKFLSLVCSMTDARRVLEFGTLAGYSTLWFAHAVGPNGHVTTMELDASHARVAQANFTSSGLADRIELLEGPALDSSRHLIEKQVEPFDLVFIDADKPNNVNYLNAALQLTHAGSIIVCDNIVRNGGVIDSQSKDRGFAALGPSSRQFLMNPALMRRPFRPLALRAGTV